MDALAGYGSDSSSSSTGEKNDDEVKASLEVNKSAPFDSSSVLSGLLASGLDSSSGDEYDDAKGGNTDAVLYPHQTASTSTPVAFTLQSPINAKRKRPRIDGDLRSLLPTPMTSPAPSGEESMILWNRDYLSLPLPTSRTERNDETDHKAITPKKYATFEQLVSSLPNGKSWAEHLQEQQEFHNPHFFQSVVDYFGISQPLGSQLDAS